MIQTYPTHFVLIVMKKNLLHKIILVTVFILLTVAVSSQTAIIRGIIKNGEEVLPAATVSVGNKTTLTDNKGEFSFSIKQGNYLLTVTYVGYKKFEQSVSILSGQTKSLEVNMIKDEQMGDLVVILGSRSAIQRSNLNTTVPVDAISTKSLLQTGQPGLIQMLSFTVPSLNTSRQNLWEPITLRGLYPDHVLILMNGIRYHPSAWLNPPVAPLGILGKGSVANDLNSIPFSAIEKIEILRDGATAQYGSDAIAGVINIELRKSTNKTFINLHLGQQYKGDGENIIFGVNRGFSLHKKGFINFSADFRHRGATERGGLYNETVYYDLKKYPASQRDSIRALDNKKIIERNFSRKTPVSNVGNLQLINSGFLINGGYNIGNTTKLFWTGAVNYRNVYYPGAYRFPKDTNAVISALYPDGFKVKIYIPSWDVSGIAGARGETNKEWHWDLRSAYGSNTVSFEAKNTNNASQFAWGKNAQTEFYCGSLSFKQLTNNISFTRNFAKKINRFKSFNLGFGAEWRFENYQIKKGEEASHKNYDTTNNTQGGAQGLPGFSDSNTANTNRNVIGMYVDLESDINDHLLIDIAGRYEYYGNYGSNLAGKLAIRYRFSDKFLLRGSVSNGFHAPTPQQTYYSSTSSGWKDVNGGRVPAVVGTFRNNSDIVRNGFGVPALKPEKALNLGGGFTSSFLGHFNLTIDAYWIQIKDRTVFSGGFGKSNPDVRNILVNYPNIDSVVFISNAISTRTHGVDIILNSHWKVRKSNLHISLAANFNRTHIFGVIQSASNLPADTLNTNTLFSRGERGKVELGQPRDKIILNINYKTGNWTFIVNNTHFGKTAFINNSDSSRDEFFSSKILTDVNVCYAPKSWLNITLGANNVFDVYPDRLKNYKNTQDGILIYSNEGSPFGYNGGYYFVNMSFNF